MRGAEPAAVTGGLVAVVGAVLPWLRARETRPELDLTSTAVSSLGEFAYTATDKFPSSAAMVVLVAGLVTAVGALIRTWVVIVVGALVGLVVGGLWLGLAAAEFEPVALPWNDLRLGAFITLGGLGLALVMGLTMRPRKEELELVE